MTHKPLHNERYPEDLPDGNLFLGVFVALFIEAAVVAVAAAILALLYVVL